MGFRRSDIPDRRNRQRELGALILLPDDHRNKDPRPGGSDIPTLRYGETELPDEGHQECLDFCDTSIGLNECSSSDCKKNVTGNLRKPPPDAAPSPRRESEPYR